MEPYIIELLCKPANNDKSLTDCHVSACAITATPETAISMAINLAMSHSYIVEAVAGAVLKNSLPNDDNSALDELLYQKALQRQPQCALQISASNEDHSSVEVRSLGSPQIDKIVN